MPSGNFAGSWGEGKLKARNLVAKIEGVTTNKEMFSSQHIDEARERKRNTYSKFRNMKEKGTMILKYTDTNTHFEESTIDWGSAADDDRSIGSSASRSSLGRTNGNNDGSQQPSLSMNRTYSKLLKLGDAPVAIGRSGDRVEQGINASGLLGERLLDTKEPSRNTFAQRSWLPYDDPALLLKVGGVPEAHMPNDVSLHLTNTIVQPGWVHQRSPVFTGGPLSKIGSRKAGVYMDEYGPEGPGGAFDSHALYLEESMKNEK